MAQLSDVPLVIRSIGWKEFLKRIWQQMAEDDLFTWAASLAYSWIFAIFPFLIFLLTLVPLMPERSRAHAGDQIKAALIYLPENAAAPLREQVDSLLNTTHGGLLSIGLVIALWAASGGMSMTMTALDRCYDIKVGRTFIRQRFLALLLTMVSTVLIILVMILLPVAGAVIKWFKNEQPILYRFSWAFNIVRFGTAILLLMTILALLYHFGPSLKRRFHFLTPGSVFSVTVWFLLALAFRGYINAFGAKSYSATYGAVAGVAILLLFFYIDAIILLIGSEVNSEIDFVVLGVSSEIDGATTTHPLRTLSPSETRLAEQLNKKRRMQQAQRSTPVPNTAVRPAAAPPTQTTPPTSVDRILKRGAFASVIAATASLAGWAVIRSMKKAQELEIERERLRAAFPETYSVLNNRR